VFARRGHTLRLPWWLVVAYGSVVFFEGAVTLSNPIAYASLWNFSFSAEPLTIAPGGLRLWRALGPALLVLVVSLYGGRDDLGAAVLFQLAPGLALGLGFLVLCAGVPPLVPVWTAHASVVLAFVVGGTLSIAVALIPLCLAASPGSGPATLSPR
jgi:hypothetical protein